MTPNHSRFPIEISASLVSLLTLCLVAVGCGTNEYRPVSGTITNDGNPVETGRITFYPKTEGGSRAFGTIESGAYSLISGKDAVGAKPGEYDVTIEAIKITADGPVAQSLQDEIAGIGANTKIERTYLVNPKYSQRFSSGLTATVSEGGDNKIDFPLQEDGK